MSGIHFVPGAHVERVARTGSGEITMAVRSTRTGACCPSCRTISCAPHRTYVRRPSDLPSLGRTVRLELRVQRFYCRNPSCPRRTFAERLPGVLDIQARRTRRLAAAQTAVAVEVGGEAGARRSSNWRCPRAQTRWCGSPGAPHCRASGRCAQSVSMIGRSGSERATVRSSSIWRSIAWSTCCADAYSSPHDPHKVRESRFCGASSFPGGVRGAVLPCQCNSGRSAGTQVTEPPENPVRFTVFPGANVWRSMCHGGRTWFGRRTL